MIKPWREVAKPHADVLAENAQEGDLYKARAAVGENHRREDGDEERVARGQDGHADCETEHARAGVTHQNLAGFGVVPQVAAEGTCDGCRHDSPLGAVGVVRQKEVVRYGLVAENQVEERRERKE